MRVVSYYSVAASSMICFAVSERYSGLLTHQIQACVSKTIIAAPSNLPAQRIGWEHNTAKQDFATKRGKKQFLPDLHPVTLLTPC